jgi:hypothetical protein
VPDNTTLNVGTAGDVIRDVLKGAVKTPVVIIDVGGAGAEVLLAAGQQTTAASLPVVIASNQTAVPVNVGTTGGLALDATLTGGGQISQAVGNVAHDAVDSGAPLKVGGKANNSVPTSVQVGDRVDALFSLTGVQVVTLGQTSTSADGNANPSFTLMRDVTGGLGNLAVFGMLYNGSSIDRPRNNHEVTVLASAARTAAINSSDQTNYNARTLYLTWDITAATTGTLTLTIKYKDTLSGKYVTLLASAAQTGVGTVALKVGPDLTATANLIAKEALPRLWRAEVTGSDGSSWTYSVSANYSL